MKKSNSLALSEAIKYFTLCSKFTKEFLKIGKDLDNGTLMKMLNVCYQRMLTIVKKKRKIQ